MKDVYKAPNWKNDKLDNNVDSTCEITSTQEIYKLINVNEIKTESRPTVIAAVEQCPPIQSAKSFKSIRNRVSYTVPNSYVRDTEFKPPP